MEAVHGWYGREAYTQTINNTGVLNPLPRLKPHRRVLYGLARGLMLGLRRWAETRDILVLFFKCLSAVFESVLLPCSLHDHLTPYLPPAQVRHLFQLLWAELCFRRSTDTVLGDFTFLFCWPECCCYPKDNCQTESKIINALLNPPHHHGHQVMAVFPPLSWSDTRPCLFRSLCVRNSWLMAFWVALCVCLRQQSVRRTYLSPALIG